MGMIKRKSTEGAWIKCFGNSEPMPAPFKVRLKHLDKKGLLHLHPYANAIALQGLFMEEYAEKIEEEEREGDRNAMQHLIAMLIQGCEYIGRNKPILKSFCENSVRDARRVVKRLELNVNEIEELQRKLIEAGIPG